MKHILSFSIPVLALMLTGCVSQTEAPVAGPTAKITASVTNFAADRSIIKGVENVTFVFEAKDGSWKKRDLVTVKNPSKTYTAPAGKEIYFGMGLIEGGWGYSSGCNASVDKSLEPGGTYLIEMTLIRPEGSPVVTSCYGALTKVEDGQKHVIALFGKGANLTEYKVKTTY